MAVFHPIELVKRLGNATSITCSHWCGRGHALFRERADILEGLDECLIADLEVLATVPNDNPTDLLGALRSPNPQHRHVLPGPSDRHVGHAILGVVCLQEPHFPTPRSWFFSIHPHPNPPGTGHPL